MQLIEHIPWRLKFSVALLRSFISKVPHIYDFFRKLGIFRYGQMDTTEYASNIFEYHFSKFKKYHGNTANFTMLELGPGDSAFSSILANASGAEKSYLVDVGNFIEKDVSIYKKFVQDLMEKGKPLPDLSEVTNLHQILRTINATYLVNGLNSLKTIPAHSIDLIWSQAVLEHIVRADFCKILREFRRILKPNGILSHFIDLKDHLGGSLNNLRVPYSLWESKLNQKYGIYTNRLRFSEIKDIFHKAGFNTIFYRIIKWKNPVIKKANLNSIFQNLSQEDLAVNCFYVILKPNR